MDVTYLSLFALLINLFAGIIIFVRGSKYPLARHFFILCISVSFWALFDYLSLTATNKDLAWWFGGIRTTISLLAVTILFHFSLRLTEHPILKDNSWYTMLLYIPVIFVGYIRLYTRLFALDMQMESFGYDIVAGPYYIVPVAYGFVLSALTLILLLSRIRKESDKTKKSQYAYTIAGASLPLLVSVIVYTILPIVHINVKYLASVFMMFMPIIISLSIAKNELLMPFTIFTGSIKSKIFSVSVLSTFLIILPGIAFIYASSRNNIYAEIQQQIEIVLTQNQATSDKYFQSLYQSFTLIAKKPELTDMLESSKNTNKELEESIHSELLRTTSSFEQVLSISIVDTNKNIILSTTDAKPSILPSTEFTTLTKSTFLPIEKRETGFQHFLVSPITNPKNAIIGYLVSAFNAEYFYNELKTNHVLNYANTLYLVDQSNTLISPIENYDESLVLTQTMPEKVGSMCSKQSTATKSVTVVKYMNFTNQSVLGAAAQLTSVPWCLVFEVNEKDATQPLRSILLTALVISLVSIIAITFISEWFGQIISNPIVALEAGTRIISQGDYNYKVATDTNDEIGSLSRAFDQMTASLKETRDSIDEKVAEQTKDLRGQKDALIRQQKQMVTILSELEDEKEKSDLLAADLEKFQRAVANASDHIIITDENGYIIYGNASVERITGFTPTEILGQKAGSPQNWGGQMPKSFYKRLWKTIKLQKKPFSGELTNKRKDGTQYQVFATITPIFNKEGQVQFYLGIERDITKEKEVDRAKTEFVSLASHQLRTPLSAINWYTEMLLDGDAGKLNEEQKNYLREIYAGNQRMVDLVTSLLNVSRLELGTFSVEPEKFDLVQIAQEVLKEMQPLVSLKNMKVTTEFNKLPLICVDKKLTYIIFQNLISNALKYTPKEGNVSIKITKKAPYAIITVTDNGMGIPKEQQEHIYEKLFRASNAKESVTEGTGLGLYIVKSVLDHTGGKINFVSTVGKGTTFTVKIPLKGMQKKEGAKKLT